VKRINSINERYYQGIVVETEYFRYHQAQGEVHGFWKKTPAAWNYNDGLVGMVFESLDAKNTTTEIVTSLAEGKGYFEFIITWEKK